MKIRKNLNLNQVRMNKGVTPKKSENTGVQDKVSINGKSDVAEWNILVYLDGDNNLQRFIDQNLRDLGKVGSDKDVNLITLFDRGPRPTGGIGGWKNAKFFRVNKGKTLDEISKDGKVLNDGKEINMSDPKILTNFIKEASKRWPAKHTLLILNDHGGGFTGVISDDHPRGFMSMPQVREALQKAGVKVDVLAYDACLMGQAEVDYETRNVADIALHSEESEGGYGWHYEQMFNLDVAKAIKEGVKEAKRAGKDFTPEALAQKVVDVNRKHKSDIPTFSAVRLGKNIENVAKGLDALGLAMTKLSDEDKKVVKNLISSTQNFGGWYKPYSDFRDIGDLAKKIVNSKQLKDENIKKIAKEFLKIYDKAIIDEEHDTRHSGATGLSAYAPKYSSGDHFGYGYEKLSFSKDMPNWEKGIKAVMGSRDTKGVNPKNPDVLPDGSPFPKE